MIGKSIMANPITYADIAAFNRETLFGLATWEKGVLVDIDDAVLSIVNRDQTKSGDDEKTKVVGENIPASNPKGVLAMFRSLGGQRTKR